MNKSQTLDLMAILRVAYPQYYSKSSKEDAKAALNLWQTMFADDDCAIVQAAVQAIIATNTSGFPPTIGQVKEKIAALLMPDLMSEQEAWRQIRKAIRYYAADEEFAKLPPILQRVVGDARQLADWAVMEEVDVNNWVSSDVKRRYRQEVATQKEQAALPESVKAMVASIGNGDVKQLEGGQ